jgi:hypothetical protein
MNPYNGFSGEQREAAQRWLNKKWESGELPRPKKCCGCGQTKGIIHAHAENYDEPYEINLTRYPLCYRCHIALHCRKMHPAGWRHYLELLRAGWSWKPIFKPNFGAIISMLSSRTERFGTPSGPPRPVLVFDTMFDEVIVRKPYKPKPDPNNPELEL